MDARPFEISTIDERHAGVGGMDCFKDIPIAFQGRIRIRISVFPAVFKRSERWGVIGGDVDAE